MQKLQGHISKSLGDSFAKPAQKIISQGISCKCKGASIFVYIFFFEQCYFGFICLHKHGTHAMDGSASN